MNTTEKQLFLACFVILCQVAMSLSNKSYAIGKDLSLLNKQSDAIRQIHDVTSYRHCVQLCTFQDKCESANYNEELKTCQLFKTGNQWKIKKINERTLTTSDSIGGKCI